MNKKLLILLLSIFIVAVFVVSFFFIFLHDNKPSPFIDSELDIVSLAKNLNEYNIPVYDIDVVSVSSSFGQEKNSYLSVKSAINAGIHGACIDVAFREDGTPVLADGAENVTEKSAELSRVFELIKDVDFDLYINITEFTHLDKIRALADDMEISRKLCVFTDDDENLKVIGGYLSTTSICYITDLSKLDTSDKEAVKEVIAKLRRNYVSKIILEPDSISSELTELMNKYSIDVVAHNADSDSGIQDVLLGNVNAIITEYPEDVQNIINALR